MYLVKKSLLTSDYHKQSSTTIVLVIFLDDNIFHCFFRKYLTNNLMPLKIDRCETPIKKLLLKWATRANISCVHHKDI